MPADLHLILHNIIGVFSAVVTAAIIVIVLANDHRKPANILFSLTMVGILVFLISHVIGVSVSDPVLSRHILMWNLSVIVICTLNFHLAMVMLHREKEMKPQIIAVYAMSAIFIAIFLIWPDTFILDSVPKMYFPNYYVPGSLHWLMRLVYQVILPTYFVYEMVRVYEDTRDAVEKNRQVYMGIMSGLGWLFGLIPIALIWNIPIDPAPGLLFPVVFAVPFTYAILNYQMMDIRIVAKKAFLYGLTIVGVGMLIMIFDASNQWIHATYPGFPFWIMPLLSAIVIVAVGVVIWRQLRISDILKYEFITTVTHKFRTPLTHIKWATENLHKAETEKDREDQMGYIETANAKLVELTDLLANASETDEELYRYDIARNDLSGLLHEAVDSAMEHAAAKNISIGNEVPADLYASFDVARMKFVIQTIMDNAINYTHEGGRIIVKAERRGKNIVCSFKDNGIGIARKETSFIFSKLYRGKEARKVDTEGMGIGLFISKGIIARNHGKIWVESDGEGKGATFSFSLPAA